MNQRSYNSEILNILELEQSITNSFYCVRKHLYSKFQSLSTSSIKEGGWSQYLDEASSPPSVTGTANGLLSLRAMGESRNSKYIIEGQAFIFRNAQDDGGWGTSRFSQSSSLTLITSLILSLLSDIGERNFANTIQKGIKWILIAQNPDGGWGILSQDSQSNLTNTVYALRALHCMAEWYDNTKDALERGLEWLWSSRNKDSSWGSSLNRPGTLAHTAEAATALLDCGECPTDLTMTRDWIMDRLNKMEGDEHFDEPYLNRDPKTKTTHRLEWAQASRELALIVMIKFGVGITDPQVQKSAQKILERYTSGTYWRAAHLPPEKEPIWAIKQAVTSLRLYRDYLDKSRPFLDLSNEVIKLHKDVQTLETEVIFLRKDVSALKTEVKKNTLNYKLIQLRNFCLSPVPLLILIIIILVVPFFLRGFGKQANLYVTLIGVVGVAITVQQFIIQWRKK